MTTPLWHRRAKQNEVWLPSVGLAEPFAPCVILWMLRDWH